MSNNINVESTRLFKSTGKEIDYCITWLNKINEYNRKWDFQIETDNNLISKLQDVKSELNYLEPQITRSGKKCIVFGKTSVGKSTFINALLSQRILPSGYGPISKYIVEVKGSTKNYNYLMVDGSDKEHEITEMSKLNEEIADQNLEDRSYIRLFYKRRRCKLLKEDVVIIDTPGIDTNTCHDKYIEKVCKEADVIILLVSAIGTIGVSDTDVISKYKTIFSKLTVLIVYTWWDEVHKTDVNGLIKQNHIENAKSFLCDVLNYSKETAFKNIYFLSCKDRLEMVSLDSRDPSIAINDLWRERNDNFNDFFKYLKRKLSENAAERIHNYLNEVYTKFSLIKSDFIPFTKEMCLKRDELMTTFSCTNYDKTNEEINARISKIFETARMELITKGSYIMSATAGKTESDKKVNPNDQMLKDLSIQGLDTLFKDIIKRSLTTLKSEIIELFSDENEETYLMRKSLLNNHYFPTYLVLNNRMSSVDMDLIRNNLSEIGRKSRATASPTFIEAVGPKLSDLGLQVISAGAIPANLIMPVAATFVGGAMVLKIMELYNSFKTEIHFNENIKEVEIEMRKLENHLLNSFSKFMKDLNNDMKQLLYLIEPGLQKITMKLDALKEELDNFLNI